MITRLLIVGATLVALGAPAAQAASPCPIFMSFFSKVQCAFVVTTGNGNTSIVDQDQRGHKHGLNLAIQLQDGDNNNAFTGQKGTNEVAVTIQDGNNNAAGTHQDGTNLASVTVQSGNGTWHTTGMSGDNAVATSSQTN